MEFQVCQHRGGLHSTLRAIDNKCLTVGYIGGSITDPRGFCNWPMYITSWLVEHYPEVLIREENCGIGATGSDLGVFRAERDLISRGCDLVFVEFAVNDAETDEEQRMRSREGLIRKLLAEKRDVVLVYTFYPKMYDDVIHNRIPKSILDFDRLGEYYQLGTAWSGLQAINEIKRGWMSWHEWVPDGVHPGHRGSLCYAQAVIDYLQYELIDHPGAPEIPSGDSLPTPLNPKNWEKTEMIPLENTRREGPFSIQRYANQQWIDRVLYTAAPGARVSFDFEGRGLCLGFSFGLYSAVFQCRIDGGERFIKGQDRAEWVPPDSWFTNIVMADDLPYGKHTFELTVQFGNAPACMGTDFRLVYIGVLK